MRLYASALRRMSERQRSVTGEPCALNAAGRLPIARGRDACDVPMVQTFGPHVLNTFRVVTEEVLQAANNVAA